MWPFTSSTNKVNDGDLEKVTKDLPADLQEFLIKENPETRNINTHDPTLPYKFESSRDIKTVDRVLSLKAQQIQRTPREQLEWDEFQVKNQIDKAVKINCSEIEAAMNSDLQDTPFWKIFASLPGSTQRDTLKDCKKYQMDGLKTLFYHKCYSQAQCLAIKMFVDTAFVKNFGELGQEQKDPEKVDQYYRDLNQAFDVLWSEK